MSTQPQPAPVLAWYKEVVREAGIDTTDIEYLTTKKFLAILAKHDPHAETVRLLEAAAKYVPANAIKGDWLNKPISEVRLLTQIRAHLAKLKGTQ